LHSRPADVAIWRQTRNELIRQGFDVYPKSSNYIAEQKKGLRLLQELRRNRVETYRNCDALIILRPKRGSWINEELETIGFDELRELDACYQKQIPCAVLDFVNDGEMQHSDFNITRFSANATWVASYRQWLHTCTNSAASTRDEALQLAS